MKLCFTSTFKSFGVTEHEKRSDKAEPCLHSRLCCSGLLPRQEWMKSLCRKYGETAVRVMALFLDGWEPVVSSGLTVHTTVPAGSVTRRLAGVPELSPAHHESHRSVMEVHREPQDTSLQLVFYFSNTGTKYTPGMTL